MDLNIQEMSRAEQLQAMEMLWDSLCGNIKEMTSPTWHEEILQEREEKIRQGEENFEDWEKAKKEIRILGSAKKDLQ